MYIHGNTLYYVSSSWMLCALFSEYVMIQWSIIARYKIQVATIDPDYVTSNVWELILWWEYECALSEAGHQMVSALSQSVWASHFPDAAFRVLLLAVLLGANDVCSVMLAPTVFLGIHVQKSSWSVWWPSSIQEVQTMAHSYSHHRISSQTFEVTWCGSMVATCIL